MGRLGTRRLGRLAGIVAAAGALAVITGASTASASAHPDRHHATVEYYVSLGDSLSVGVQPNRQGTSLDTDQGYSDDLYAELRVLDALRGIDLRLVKLGCSGETSHTMIDGGVCTYQGSNSQLGAATAFLAAHPGQVALVTLDIGSNDVDHCVGPSGIDTTCVQQGFGQLATDLPTITAALRHADPSSVTRWVGLNYYDPYLASWLSGAQGQATAAESTTLQAALNQIPQAVYPQAGFEVVDIAAAFRSTATTLVPLPGFGRVPLNVASICTLTWMCAPAPQGPNIHPRPVGYVVMSLAIAARL